MKKIFLRSLLAASLLAVPFFAQSARAGANDIYETNEGNVLRFHVSGTPSTFATGLSNPKGIAFDGNGHVFVADAGKGAILGYTVPDGSGTTFASGLSSPTGLAFDNTGIMYVSEAGTGNILKFDVFGTKSTFVTATGASAGLAFDKNQNLFTSDFNGGKIYKFTPDGTKTIFASGLDHPAGLAFDSAGNLFEADSETGTIFKFTPDGTKTSFATGIGRPYGLAFEPGGSLIVADNANGATLRYSADGVKSNVFQSDFNTPEFVAIEPAQHQLLNISTRGLVQGGDNVLIAGFIVGGNGPIGSSILIRGLGPSLSAAGVTNPLADPVLELRDASGTLLMSNNNWRDTQEAAITATTLNPTNDLESAILASLHGGAYTAILGSATGQPGTGVIEIYQLP
ncbi:MAG TPA: NHL repeat-containing protein [Chthoniobacterales bacterium]|jgi:sugar lactone lactonase YvrE|nr:NHL repeat-containing protein [Chthoniobacterales bacterium]